MPPTMRAASDEVSRGEDIEVVQGSLSSSLSSSLPAYFMQPANSASVPSIVVVLAVSWPLPAEAAKGGIGPWGLVHRTATLATLATSAAVVATLPRRRQRAARRR